MKRDVEMSMKIILNDFYGRDITVIPKVVLYSVTDFTGEEMTIPGIHLDEETEDGLEPFALITRSFGEFIGAKNCAYIDINNCPFAAKFLELGYAKETQFSKRSGFCEYPLWQFNENFLKEIGGEEYEKYSRQYDEYMQKQFGSFEESIEQSM